MFPTAPTFPTASTPCDRDITPIEKQDLEKRFWDLSNGGKIQYVKYPIDYNLDAIRTLVRPCHEIRLL